MKEQFTPLEVLIAALGNPEAVSRAAGLADKTAYSWRNGSKIRKPGDLPGTIAIRRLAQHLKDRQSPVRLQHLIYGATSAEMRAMGLIAAEEIEAAQ